MRELDLLDGLEKLEGSEIHRITFGSPSHSQFDVYLKGNKNNFIHQDSMPSKSTSLVFQISWYVFNIFMN